VLKRCAHVKQTLNL